MEDSSVVDKTKRQTINPLVDEMNRQMEPVLKEAMTEFGNPLPLSFRVYNQIRFYEEYGKLGLGVCVASRKTLAEQFGVSVKQIDGAFNNLTNIKCLGKWVEHSEPVFRNVTRTWVSNVRMKRNMDSNSIRVELNNSNGIRAGLLWDKSSTLTGLELPSEVPPLSENKKKIRENNNVTKVTLAKAVKKPVPEINEMLEYWATVTGIPINSRVPANRIAAGNLLKRHGIVKTKQLIDAAALAQTEQYAPRIADFTQLQGRLNDLLVWQRKSTGQGGYYCPKHPDNFVPKGKVCGWC